MDHAGYVALSFLFLAIWANSSFAQNLEYREQLIEAKLQLEDYDFNDAYEALQLVTKKALIFGGYFNEKVQKELELGKLLRAQHGDNLKYEGDVPYTMVRNWTLLTFTGDRLLPEKLLTSFVFFKNKFRETASSKICNDLQNCLTRQNFEDVLTSNRNLTLLKTTWCDYQTRFTSEDNVKDFEKNLHAIDQVYMLNRAHTHRSYWEMFSEYQDGYEKATRLWEDVQPLYKKLHDFVRVRLFAHYNISSNETTIPVYLLGSNFGMDWSNIADIILPHPYLLREVETELEYHSTRDIYKLAESSVKTMLGSFPVAGDNKKRKLKRENGVLGDGFWTNSIFNHTVCGPNLFSYCNKLYTETVTCDRLNWTEYLNVHEAAMSVMLRNQDYLALPREQTRDSVLDEALEGIGSVVGIESLVSYDFVRRENSSEFNRQETALLLTALRVLPRLPYYLLVDKWRLEELETGDGNLTEKWWKRRREFQGIEGETELEMDYLGDERIQDNKPYLSKFLGIFLQFQLIDYYQKYHSSDNGTLKDFIGTDENFRIILRERSIKGWSDLLSFHYGFDEISSEALLEYFEPLNKYLESAPTKQVLISTTKRPRPTTTTTTTEKPTKRRKCLKCRVTASTKKVIGTTEGVLTTPTEPNEVGKAAVGGNKRFNPITVVVAVIGGIIGIAIGVVVVRKVLRARKSNKNSREYEK